MMGFHTTIGLAVTPKSDCQSPPVPGPLLLRAVLGQQGSQPKAPSIGLIPTFQPEMVA